MRKYLFLLSTLQVPPLLHRLAQVHAAHGDLYLADHVVLGETVKVKNLQHQRLSTQLCIRDLERHVRSAFQAGKVLQQQSASESEKNTRGVTDSQTRGSWYLEDESLVEHGT